MKKIQSVVALGLMLLLYLPVQAQWAGADQTVVRKPDNSQKVVIGPSDNSPDVAYHWYGPYILEGFENNPQAVINPHNPREVYIVSRTTPCGLDWDTVVVRVVEHPTIVSVTPLKDCYNTGEPISLSDFQIVTDPPGLESMVTVTPNHAPEVGNLVDISATAPLTFTLNYEGLTSVKTVVVNVYNDDFVFDYNGTANIGNLNKFMKQLEIIEFMLRYGTDIKEILKILTIAPSLIEPQFNINGALPSWNTNPPGIRLIGSCCNGDDKLGFFVQGPKFSVEVGVEINIPTPISITLPFAKLGVYIYGDALIGASVGPFNLVIKGDCSGLKVVPIDVYIDFGFGAKAVLASDDVLSASLGVAARYRVSKDWNVLEKFTFPPVDVDLSIKGKVKALSLFSYTVDYKLGSVQLFN